MFTFANQAGLDMLETTLVGLQDIILDKILDEAGRKILCSEFPKIMQQVLARNLMTNLMYLLLNNRHREHLTYICFFTLHRDLLICHLVFAYRVWVVPFLTSKPLPGRF